MKRFAKYMVCMSLIAGTMVAMPYKEPITTIEAKKKKKVYQIGQTAKVKGIKITVNGTRVVEPGVFDTAEEGKQFLAIDCTIENTTKKDQTSSSLLWYELKTGEGRKCDQSLTMDLNGTLDSDLPAGDILAGEIGYQVPTEGELFLTFRPDFTSKTVKIQVR